jgi:hypothetical protein
MRRFYAPMLVALAVSISARADTVSLSDQSTDSTPADALDAAIDFSVNGTTLTLTASNQTPPFPQLGGYSITEIFFNAASNVSALTFSVPGEWRLDIGPIAGYGTFDFRLHPRNGIDAEIPGQSALAWDFDIQGTGPFSNADFATALSTTGAGETPALAAALFVNGPGGDTAYGVAIPEPTAALAFVGFGLAALRRRTV